VTDDLGVGKVELRIDGSLIGTATALPYAWTAPPSIGAGSHVVAVTGYDVAGTTADAQITVTVGDECTKPSDCAISTDTCVDGRCVPGSDAPGGLGTPCTSNADCFSGQCGENGTGDQYCVEPCDVTTSSCPAGFQCMAAGGGGVCWPSSGDGGGCATSGGGAGGACLLLPIAFVLVRRSRRQ